MVALASKKTLKPEEITLVKNAIHSPHEPRHFMTIQPRTGKFSAQIEGQLIAKADQIYEVLEVANIIVGAVYYFPKTSLQGDYLVASEKTTQCPLKGKARYYHAKIGEQLHENIAWSYHEVIVPAKTLKDLYAFDPRWVKLQI